MADNEELLGNAVGDGVASGTAPHVQSTRTDPPCSALSDGQPGFEVTYENMVKRPSGICQFFLVLNPQGFAGSERYGARVTHIADVVSKAKGIEGAPAPRLPGARDHAVAGKAKVEGIALALELAGGRVGTHGLRETASLLDGHFSRPAYFMLFNYIKERSAERLAAIAG